MYIQQPMKASRLKKLSDIRYPILMTPKIDGIRCITTGERALSRSFKLIQNRHIQRLVSQLPEGVDGELVLNGATFQDTTSGIMSGDGAPDFKYMVFDWCFMAPYRERVKELHKLAAEYPFVEAVLPTEAHSEVGFLRFEEQCLEDGYEGVVFRDPDGPYKFGRSTSREGYMVKVKRVHDSEAIIQGFEEARENQNPIVPNAFGYAKRPGGAGRKVPKGTLGSLLVQDVHSGVQFSIGTGKGLTAALRKEIWDNQPRYLGSIVRYTYQAEGTMDRPRFPSFQAFRSPDDL